MKKAKFTLFLLLAVCLYGFLSAQENPVASEPEPQPPAQDATATETTSGESLAEPEKGDPLKEKEQELRTQLVELRRAADLSDEQLRELSEEDRKIFQIEEEERIFAGLELVYQLADNLLKQEEAGNDTVALRELVTERMAKVPEVLLRALDRFKEEVKTLREELETAEPSEMGILAEQIAAKEDNIDQLLGTAVAYLEQSSSLQLEDESFRQTIVDAVKFRARLLAGRLKKATANRAILRKRASANPDDADLALRIGATQVAIDSSVRSLERMVRQMETLELDTTVYKAILIQSTGDISKGFELSVIWEFAKDGWTSLTEWTHDQLPGILTKTLVFLIVLAIFHLLGKLVQGLITRAVHSSRVNVGKLLGVMIAKTSYRVIIVFGILVALSQIGISLTPLLAGLGVAGFIVGFALQDTLGNFASGLMILFYRPFDEGDFVESAGVMGWVHKMSLVSTTILTIDNQTLIIPNSKIWGDVICNRSEQENRRVDLVFGVSYSADIPKTEKVIHEVLDSCPLILPEPEPVVRVHELGDSSVNFVVRPWVKNADYWETHWYLTREMKIRFDQEGIGIPFPQRDVHHYYPEKPGPSPESTDA